MMQRAVTSIATIAALVAAITHALPPRVQVPVRSTFANNAWGLDNMPASALNVTGRLVVIEDIDGVSAARVAALKAQGHIVQCYFSVGTVETFRPDVQQNRAAWKAIQVPGPADPDWGEFWIDVRKLDAIAKLMSPRFQRAKAMGCDAIEADNVDCYDSPYCQGRMKGVTRAAAKTAQIAYNLWQLNTSHSLGLALSLKNAADLLANATLFAAYDFAVNEQCFYYQECNLYKTFLASGRAVLNTEYDLQSVCASALAQGITTEQCSGGNNAGLCEWSKSNNWKYCSPAAVPLPAITTTTAA